MKEQDFYAEGMRKVDPTTQFERKIQQRKDRIEELTAAIEDARCDRDYRPPHQWFDGTKLR